MAVTRYQLKKWIKKYVLKTQQGFRQGVGTVYSKDELKGYYNDLREKVTDKPLPENELPKSFIDSGEQIHFSIGIMQYGLGSYDLYLLEKDESMKRRMFLCADWAVENQKENGAWETFAHIYPEHPYSSMAQGEGVSLLVRAYAESGDVKYLEAAKKAVYFMLVPVEQGGVCINTENELIFKEYTERPIVMNGWIFSLWGLFDYVKATGDEKIKEEYLRSLATLEKYIPHYDLGYWTRYDYSERVASPSYHKLHIDQFTVMYDLTGHEIFAVHLEKFKKYRDSFYCRNRGFVVKAFQKLRGK
ncbi:MAG: thioredoxin [Clostridia bacterium]|nr:thioredoxin [Clostridia bacterium]